jgi:hypothetical protein
LSAYLLSIIPLLLAAHLLFIFIRNNLTLSSLMEDKWTGLILALSSSFLIGASYIVTKKGLLRSKNSGMSQILQKYLHH